MTDLIPSCLRSQETVTTVYAGKTGPRAANSECLFHEVFCELTYTIFIFFIVAPYILIFTQLIHQQMHIY